MSGAMSKRGHRAIVTLLLALSTIPVGAPRTALADDDEEPQSRQLFRQGEAAASAGKWPKACPLFQAAHDLHSTGGTALRTADCYERMGRVANAIAMYQYIVDNRATDKEPERVALAESRILALKKMLADGEPIAASDLAAIEGQPAPPPPPPPPSSRKIPIAVAFSAGGAFVVTGAVLGIMALSQAQTVRDECHVRFHSTNCPDPKLSAEANSATVKAWASTVAFGLGIAGLATGTVLVLKASPSTKKAVLRTVGPDGLTLRF